MARLNRGVKDDPSDLRLSRWEDAEDRAGVFGEDLGQHKIDLLMESATTFSERSALLDSSPEAEKDLLSQINLVT
ncbi:hypothetical protein TRIATDRAFT_313121 [Trichoderma atroviride IMI 206040]|uniref:Uncharacterized protein n=1 Tax=Hypocrea atroviridis (strain ATCC 20476 / IMI 206040) TaxID=452589 RepID=G9PB17_HYPAI|nr:uncharacterized protein TRIATDRAFT_313121 [Trichoderma atroviride IMI 206040]EHK40198.1 hypothetical protein TRIATDRAFT_313121 [Trichoderma atroviride IMI 206040]